MRTKILLLTFFLMISIFLKAQPPAPSGLPAPYSTGYYRIGWLQGDSGSIFANRAPNFTPKYPFTTIGYVHPGVDTALWLWTGATWEEIGKGGGIASLTGVSPIVFRNDSILCPTCAVGGGITQLTGDGTAGPGSGSQAFTLATVNTNVGSFGDAAHVADFTVNGKGLITIAGSIPIQIAESQVTNLTSDLASKQGTITLGSTSQYFRGDLSLATFPTNLSSFTNGPGYITGITGIGAGGALAGTYPNPTLLSVITAGTCTNCALTYNAAGQITVASSGSGGGSLTGGGGFSPLFTNGVSGSTLTFTAVNAAANSVFMNNTGSSAPAAFSVPSISILNGWASGSIALLGTANTWTALQTLGTLTTTGATKFTGISSGTSTDSILTINPSTGNVTWRTGQPYNIYAVQLLSAAGTTQDSFKLGGILGTAYQNDSLYFGNNQWYWYNLNASESSLIAGDSAIVHGSDGHIKYVPTSAFGSGLSGTGFVSQSGTTSSYINGSATNLIGYNASGSPSAIVLGTNLSMTGNTLNASGSGSSQPFPDNSALIENNSDHTKTFLLTLNNQTTSTLITDSVPPINTMLAGVSFSNTFGPNQNFSGNILPTSGTQSIGSSANAWVNFYGQQFRSPANLIMRAGAADSIQFQINGVNKAYLLPTGQQYWNAYIGNTFPGNPAADSFLTINNGVVNELSIAAQGWTGLGWIDVVGTYGADPTGVTDASTAFQNAANAVVGNGQIWYLRPGTYKITHQINFPNKSVHILGSGGSNSGLFNTAGTAIYRDTTTDITRVIFTSKTDTLFKMPGNGSIVEGMDLIDTATGSTSSVGLFIGGTGLKLLNMGVSSFYDNIVDTLSLENLFLNVFCFNPVNYGYLQQNRKNADAGDNVITGCFFYSGNNNANAMIRLESSGGTKISLCKFNGNGGYTGSTKNCIWLYDSLVINSTSDLKVTGNSFENFTGTAVLINVVSGGVFYNVQINDNQISPYTTTGNGIETNGATEISINNNLISQGGGGSTYGVFMDTGPVSFLGNYVNGYGTNISAGPLTGNMFMSYAAGQGVASNLSNSFAGSYQSNVTNTNTAGYAEQVVTGSGGNTSRLIAYGSAVAAGLNGNAELQSSSNLMLGGTTATSWTGLLGGGFLPSAITVYTDSSGTAIGQNSTTSPHHTLEVYNQVASTGTTSMLIQGGAAAIDAGANPLFRINKGGGTTNIFSVQGNGITTFGSYGAGTNTGTAATYPAFTSSGQLIESSTPYSPTLQQVLNTGTTLTGTNTISIGSGTLAINGSGGTLAVGATISTGLVISTHVQGNAPSSQPPSISAGSGAGTSPTVGLTGGDQTGIINVTTGTLPTGGATIVTVTYHSAYSNGTYPILTPANAATALLSGATMIYTTGTTTTFVIIAGTTGLAAATAYSWYYYIGAD